MRVVPIPVRVLVLDLSWVMLPEFLEWKKTGISLLLKG